ncbi:MAG: 23S rRNA (guanosine(2251)-2'-O)-methyltransferase RlmB [Deltaproteobacteria bacterium RIFCSPLOWO2_02_FULL_57_26]|nr:MAG: 23S rRNA (guanosine(2251)-2'-O)-methyltransferase RlmB [Deltaproteobacteria bacterium RIFCSPLOWO2_02_FULL_57_26]
MQTERKPVLLFGINPVLEKLRASPAEVWEVMLVTERRSASLRSIDQEARRRGLSVRYVEAGRLDTLAEGRNHQGVVARVAPYPYCDFADLLGDLPASPGHHWVLLLDGLNDPRNFGAVLRCAEGVGIQQVVIPKDRSVGVTPVVAKTSAGAVHHLKIYRVPNLRRAIGALKKKGYWAVGLDAGAKEGAYQRIYPEKLAVVLGSEGSGLRPMIRQECDFLVSLPMRGKVESLNVAVAGGIFLYELLRQKEQEPRIGAFGSVGREAS